MAEVLVILSLLACVSEPPLTLPARLHLQIGDSTVVTVRSDTERQVEPSIVGENVVVEAWLVDEALVQPDHPLELGVDAYVVGDLPPQGAYARDLVLTSTAPDGSDPIEQTIPVVVVVP